jgi:hypothetical protein
MDFAEGSNMKAPRGLICPLEPFFSALLELSLLYKTHSFKVNKEKTFMAKRKSIWILFGILVISTWVLGPAIQAGAETMNCKTSGNSVKREAAQIPDVEGHTININMREGLAFFENGEVAALKSSSTWDGISGKRGRSQGYMAFTFVDGSTIIISFLQMLEADQEGKLSYFTKSTGEILKGTGRFEGIKGSASGTGKQLKAEKGELTGKTANDWTYTYTLPTK